MTLALVLCVSFSGGLFGYSTNHLKEQVTLTTQVKKIINNDLTSIIQAMDFILRSIDRLNNINKELRYDYIPVNSDFLFKTVSAPTDDFLSA